MPRDRKEYALKYRTENKDRLAIFYHERYLQNKEAILVRSREYYHKNKEKNKDFERNRKFVASYGITLETYNVMLDKQDHCCDICKRHVEGFSRRLAIDHNHTTGKVRGLLCTKCNVDVGVYENRGEEIRNYLNSYEEIKEILK